VISQRFHRGFTATEKTELRDRRQPGQSLKAIGRAFSKPSSSIYLQLASHGGIRPAPRPRRRSRPALTLSEREEISRGSAAAQSARSMARLLGRSPSRELNRNVSYDRYRAALRPEAAIGLTMRAIAAPIIGTRGRRSSIRNAPSADAVHEFRRSMKQWRALMRLLKPFACPKFLGF
jgi:hypothetical protein